MKYLSIRGLKNILLQFGVTEKIIGWLRSRRSFSQFGEDVYILGYYTRLKHDLGIDIRNGIIVDIGSFSPVRLSNSYVFSRMGWRGINIDPTPGSKKLFDTVRKRDVNLEIAISPQVGEADFYVFGPRSVWNTLSESAALNAQKKLGHSPIKIKVSLAPLSDIFAQYIGNSSLFEILLIDAEGLDLEILQTNDWTKFSPRVVLVEVHELDNLMLGGNAVVRYMIANGYRLYAHNNPNLMFVRSDSL